MLRSRGHTGTNFLREYVSQPEVTYPCIAFIIDQDIFLDDAINVMFER